MNVTYSNLNVHSSRFFQRRSIGPMTSSKHPDAAVFHWSLMTRTDTTAFALPPNHHQSLNLRKSIQPITKRRSTGPMTSSNHPSAAFSTGHWVPKRHQSQQFQQIDSAIHRQSALTSNLVSTSSTTTEQPQQNNNNNKTGMEINIITVGILGSSAMLLLLTFQWVVSSVDARLTRPIHGKLTSQVKAVDYTAQLKAWPKTLNQPKTLKHWALASTSRWASI